MLFTDQLGSQLSLAHMPQRIISLVPSQTELLSHLGLEEKVIGITRFCVHPPEWRSRKTIVGGTKNFHFDVIDQLQPDLIIGNKEENYQEGIEKLRLNYPVWMSDIADHTGAEDMILGVGQITGQEERARALVQDIQKAFETVVPLNGGTVLYLIWRKPWMAAGRLTFIDTMLAKTGLQNSVTDARYPELSNEIIAQLKPHYIFLSSEPYPFTEKHISEIQAICPEAKIVLVDGEMFSWYGSRLLLAPDYFNKLRSGLQR
jgi:ABC-type Fe3+-hydroxamate transport system substrate-binding protein